MFLCLCTELRSREERSQFFDANIGPDAGNLPEDDMYASYDKVCQFFFTS